MVSGAWFRGTLFTTFFVYTLFFSGLPFLVGGLFRGLSCFVDYLVVDCSFSGLPFLVDDFFSWINLFPWTSRLVDYLFSWTTLLSGLLFVDYFLLGYFGWLGFSGWG